MLFSKETFEDFLKDFPNICAFRPKREKLTQDFLISFEKSSKIIIFLQFSFFFGNFQNFLTSGGLRPPDHLRGRHPKMFSPRNEILAAPLESIIIFNLHYNFSYEEFHRVLMSFILSVHSNFGSHFFGYLWRHSQDLEALSFSFQK